MRPIPLHENDSRNNAMITQFMCRSVCKSHPHPHQLFHSTHAAQSFSKERFTAKERSCNNPCFSLCCVFKRLNPPFSSTIQLLTVLDSEKKSQSHLKQFPTERFHSIRTILLHQNDSTSSERFYSIRTIPLQKNDPAIGI